MGAVATVFDAQSDWVLLHDKIWTTEAADAGSSTAGARTFGGLSGVIVNAAGAFLKATGGVSIEAGRGLKLDTTSCSTGPTADLPNNGAGVYFPLTTLLGSTVWQDAQPGPELVWDEIVLAAVMDFSGVATHGEGGGIFVINRATDFGHGTITTVLKNSGNINCGQTKTGPEYVTTDVLQSAIAIPTQPDVCVCVTAHHGGSSYWGKSPGGVAYPTGYPALYSRDQFLTCMTTNDPQTAGGHLRNTAAIGMMVWDSGKTAIQLWCKRWTLWGRKKTLPIWNYGQLHIEPGGL